MQYDNPFIILSPNDPSREDKLKSIDVRYDQSLVKEDVMPQTLNRMNSGQGKLLHMGIMDFHINKVLAQIIYDMLTELLILLNQYHTNRLLRHSHVNQEIMAIVQWTKHRGFF